MSLLDETDEMLSRGFKNQVSMSCKTVDYFIDEYSIEYACHWVEITLLRAPKLESGFTGWFDKSI